MVDSGIPDELPRELTAGFARKQAMKEQNQLLRRLGDRLGVNAITSSAAQGVDQFGDTKNIGAEKRHKRLEKLRLKGINS